MTIANSMKQNVQKANPSKQGLKPIMQRRLWSACSKKSKKLIHQNKDWNRRRMMLWWLLAESKKLIHQNKDWNYLSCFCLRTSLIVQKANPSKQGLKPKLSMPLLWRYSVSKKLIHQNKDWNNKPLTALQDWEIKSKKLIHQNKDWNNHPKLNQEQIYRYIQSPKS